MGTKIHPKHVLDHHRQSFYHMLRALIALHEQIGHMVIPYLEETEYLSVEHKKRMEDWLDRLHKKHRRYTETVDEGFSVLESYFDIN